MWSPSSVKKEAIIDQLSRATLFWQPEPYSHSITLKLPGREDFHELSDFCNPFCWLSGTPSIGLETSWGTTVGLEEYSETEKRDCIKPLTEGERKICGRTSAVVVESVSCSMLIFWDASKMGSGTVRKARVSFGWSLRLDPKVEGRWKSVWGSCIGVVNERWRNYRMEG